MIYGDNKFGSQVSPSGLERDGEPWVFGYDRATIPSCTLSETKDELFAIVFCLLSYGPKPVEDTMQGRKI